MHDFDVFRQVLLHIIGHFKGRNGLISDSAKVFKIPALLTPQVPKYFEITRSLQMVCLIFFPAGNLFTILVDLLVGVIQSIEPYGARWSGRNQFSWGRGGGKSIVFILMDDDAGTRTFLAPWFKPGCGLPF